MNLNFLRKFKRGKVISSSSRTTCWLTPQIKAMLKRSSEITGLSQAHIIRQSILHECQKILAEQKSL